MKYIITLLIVSILMVFFSCSKMDENYKIYTQDGERVYPGKVDSILSQPGDNRLKLSWLESPDPSVAFILVDWLIEGVKDSMRVDVNKDARNKYNSVIIKDLAEGEHTLNIVSRDIYGNESIKEEIPVRVYGDVYRSFLSNSVVNEANYFIDQDSLEIKLSTILDTTVIGHEINFLSKDNKPVKRVFAVEQESFRIGNYKRGGDVAFRTLYLPNKLAIDTFYSESAKLEIIEK